MGMCTAQYLQVKQVDVDGIKICVLVQNGKPRRTFAVEYSVKEK